MNEFTAKSTGSISGITEPLPYTVLSMPLPAATQIEIGPFSESTQPGYGSLNDGVTIRKNEICHQLQFKSRLINVRQSQIEYNFGRSLKYIVGVNFQNFISITNISN